ncbi:MAG: cellulase N-terminal Ig-like domain-containing protein [Chitinophagaceae bacterium]
MDSATGKTVFTGTRQEKILVHTGPFKNTYRLNFSSYNKSGVYYLKAGNATSPVFKIDNDVYKGQCGFLSAIYAAATKRL